MAADVTRTRTMPHPVEAVWAVLADFAGIARWAPQVSHAVHLHGPPTGPGAARRVQVGRLALVETVTDWEPERLLAYRIEGLPRPLGRVTTTWRLSPSGSGTTVEVRTSVDAGPRPPQLLVARVGARRLGAAGDQMLDGLAARLAADARTPDVRNPSGPRHHHEHDPRPVTSSGAARTTTGGTP